MLRLVFHNKQTDAKQNDVEVRLLWQNKLQVESPHDRQTGLGQRSRAQPSAQTVRE
jgi:hypothetical protein